MQGGSFIVTAQIGARPPIHQDKTDSYRQRSLERIVSTRNTPPVEMPVRLHAYQRRPIRRVLCRNVRLKLLREHCHKPQACQQQGVESQKCPHRQPQKASTRLMTMTELLNEDLHE